MDQQTGQSNYKIGVIYKRSKILKSWNKRSIVLNYIKGNLSLRKGKHSKEKIILLENYEVAWVGQSKKSKVFYFNLKAIKDIKSQKYKRLLIGDTNEQNARLWMDEIEKIIDKKFLFQSQAGLTPHQISQKQRELSEANNDKKSPQVYQNKSGLLTVPKVPGPSQYNTGQQVRAPHEGAFMSSAQGENSQIFLNGKSQKPGQGRSIVIVNKDDDPDEFRKQFESYCGEGDGYNECDERQPNEEGPKIPNFNDHYNVQFMPDTIVDNPDIEAIYQNAPESIQEEVQQTLEGYYKKKQNSKDGLFCEQNSQKLQENIYKKNDEYYLIYEIPGMKPGEIYEVKNYQFLQIIST